MLLSTDLLNEWPDSHELYELLATVVPRLSSADLLSLVEAISVPSDPTVQGIRASYELLSWIVQYRGKRPAKRALEVVRAKLAPITQSYPEWKPRDDPGRHFGSVTVSFISQEEQAPWPIDAFHTMVSEDAGLAVSNLLAEVRDGDWQDGPPHRYPGEWCGPDHMVSNDVAQHPEDGLAIWDALDTGEADDTEKCEAKDRVVQGWSHTSLDEEMTTHIFERLMNESASQPWNAMADFLIATADRRNLGAAWAKDPRARNLARTIFSHTASDPPTISGENIDSKTLALNCSVGKLAFFWTAAAIAETSERGYPGGLLSAEVADALNELIDNPAQGLISQAAIMSALQFFNQADPDWTASRVITLLDPAKGWSQVVPLWDAVLFGIFDDDLLDTGVREWLVEWARDAPPTDSQTRSRLTNWLSSITVYSAKAPRDRLAWMAALSAITDEDLRTQWLVSISHRLKDLDPPARASSWEQWGKNYVASRVSQQPVALTSNEVAALVRWAAFLEGDQLREIAGALEKTCCGLPGDDHVFVPDLGRAIERDPDVWASLLDSLLKATQKTNGPSWGLSILVEEALKAFGHSRASSDAVKSIRESAYRLGLIAAAHDTGTVPEGTDR
jgi:hypothetical protein